MKRTSFIALLFLAVCALCAWQNPAFLNQKSISALLTQTALYAIPAIGLLFVFMTRGIDLSIGSVVGLTSSLLPWLLVHKGWSLPLALLTVIAVSVLIGFTHGFLVSKKRLHPLLVTLAGLLVYHGITNSLSNAKSTAIGKSVESLGWLANGQISVAGYSVPAPFLIMLGVAVITAVVLNGTVFGRHLVAVSRDKHAALCAGIRTERIHMMAYVICSTLAGLVGLIVSLSANALESNALSMRYEVYAIAAALIAGFTLMGSRGSVISLLLGSALLTVIGSLIKSAGYSADMELAAMGLIILIASMANERFNRDSSSTLAI